MRRVRMQPRLQSGTPSRRFKTGPYPSPALRTKERAQPGMPRVRRLRTVSMSLENEVDAEVLALRALGAQT
jgi:hypothetical protein